MLGDNKQPWWQRILMGGAIAEAPSIMTAAGHKIEKDGTVTVDNQNDAGVKQLRSSLPVIGSAPILSVAATNPATYPWIAKNVVLPVLGGEVVNETTRKLSDNKYNSFGDFVYNGSGLANVANNTFVETPLRFITDMSNPAYWAPYGKITQTIGPIIDKSISSTVGNIIGEIARRSKSTNLRNFANASDLVPAKLPHLYRAIGRMSDYAAGGWDNVSGKFSKYFRLNGAGRKSVTTSNNIVNFTTDQKVINHVADPSKGWDQSDVIVFPRSFTEKVLPYIKSTAPMDTFIQLEQKIAIPKKQLWKITGDINPTHFKRISSRKLRSEFKPFAETTNLPGYNHSNNSFLTKVGGGKHWTNITDAQNEIIWRRFGRPLEKDIKLLEEKTGLPSGIIKPSEFQIYVDDLISHPRMGPEFMHDPGFSTTRSRIAGEQNLPSDYKYIYNPYIEFMFREHPEIYKKYINTFKTFKSRLPKINIENSTQKRILPVMLYNIVNSNND